MRVHRTGVAPLAGAWIETSGLCFVKCSQLVAPLAGAWIETDFDIAEHCGITVAPLAGAWIETCLVATSLSLCVSRPSRARGLKPYIINLLTR